MFENIFMFFANLIDGLPFDFRIKRAPHVRKVLKKEGLKLTKREYVKLCLTGGLTVNGRLIQPNTRLETGVYILDVYAEEAHIRYWVETGGKKTRTYTM